MPEDKKDRSGLSRMHHRGPIKATQPPRPRREKVDPMVDAIGMTREELADFHADQRRRVSERVWDDTLARTKKNDK